MINPLFILGYGFYISWFLIIAALITCVSRKRANTSPLEQTNRPSGKSSQRTEEIFGPCNNYNSAEVKTSVSRTKSNNKSDTLGGSKQKFPVKQISSKKKLDQNWKRKNRKVPKDGTDVEEPSADRDPSPKEEKPIVEQTRILSWNSNKRKTSSNESSLDEFEKPTPMLEVTATDVSATQNDSSIHAMTPTGAFTNVTPMKPGEQTAPETSTSPPPPGSAQTLPSMLPEQSTQPVSASGKSTKNMKGKPKQSPQSSQKVKPKKIQEKEGKSSPSTPTPPMVVLVDMLKSNPENAGSGGDKEKVKSSNSKSLENEIRNRSSVENVNRVAIITK